jgi:hypothetical protein
LVTKPFMIITNNGNCEFANVIFKNIESNNSILLLNGGGSLLIDGCVFMDSALRSSGVFVRRSTGGNGGLIEIINSNISGINICSGSGGIISSSGQGESMNVEYVVVNNISIGTTNENSFKGGIIYSNGSNTVSIVLENVKINGVNISRTGISSHGGCLWVSNCGNISIISSEFNDSIVSGNGGGIYFGEGTFYSLKNSKFSNLKAGGYGGGIYGNSGVEGERDIQDCLFSMNTAYGINSGNDIYDDSANGCSYYSPSSVSKSSSTSSPTQFVVIGNMVPRIYDCLLSNSGCEIEAVYVNGNEGFDFNLCGKDAVSACLSITKASNIVSGNSGMVIASAGNYLTTTISIINRNIIFIGANNPVGSSQLLSVVSLNNMLTGIVANSRYRSEWIWIIHQFEFHLDRICGYI